MIHGSDLTAPVAHRWKTQINENAKLPAFAPSCPRPTTTRSAAGPADADGVAAVFLEDATSTRASGAASS